MIIKRILEFINNYYYYFLLLLLLNSFLIYLMKLNPPKLKSLNQQVKNNEIAEM